MQFDDLLILIGFALVSIICIGPEVDSALNSIEDDCSGKKECYLKEDVRIGETVRQRRQFFRKKRKQSPSLMALNRLVLDTVNDTSIAYRNISVILNRQFGVEINIKNVTAITGNVTNNRTNQMFPVNELFSLLGSNYRGLVRLFNRELRNAVNDSQKNAERYRKEFRDAVRPFILMPWNRNFTITPNIKNGTFIKG